MIKPQKLITYLSSCALSACLLVPSLAQAQVQISPLVIEAPSTRGQSRGIINVTNNGDETFRARVYAAPFTYERDGIKVLDSSPNDLTPYLMFSPRELVIQPGQTRRIRLSSRLLPSLKAGEYRAIVFTENLNAIDTNNNGVKVGIVPRIGATVYVRHGDVSSSLAVASATQSSTKGRINLLVSNSGDASARPRTEWKLSRQGDEPLTGRTSEVTVIAGGDRNIPIDYLKTDETIIPGDYELSGKLIWGSYNKPSELPFNVKVKISPEAATSTNNSSKKPTPR